MRSKQLMLSPRSSVKQVRNFATLELNSYKIDTSSLSQRAKQIELLKTQLETQISQYKSSQMSYQQDLKQITDENKELKAKIKRLQTELNKFTSEPPQNHKNSNAGEIRSLKSRIQDLEEQVQKLNNNLIKKEELIAELSEYKKMYDIQVENKNNIMNFYQNKLALFKKDKVALISKYQQKISQLGSGLQINGTIIQPGPNLSNLPTPTNKNQNQRLSNFSDYIPSKQVNDPGQLKISSSKNIKIIRSSKLGKQAEKTSITNDSLQFDVQTPYKLLKNQSRDDLRFQKENTPFNRKSRNEMNDISISSSLANNNNKKLIISRKGKDTSPKKSNQNTSSKTFRQKNSFLNLIRQIFNNLRKQNIKSENLKNFGSVRAFLTVSNPSISQVIQIFDSFPFAQLEMERQQIQDCIEKMKIHLQKKYSLWSGSLLIELIIDKIQDFQIAYQVNSQDEVEIMAGLSSNQDND